MKIYNLIENEEGSCGCTPKHGLSFYIETVRHRLLCDLGPDEETLRNAEKLGVNLTDVDTVILSHGHYDHTGGVMPFVKHNPHACIYIRRTADRPYYSYDGREKGYRYIGIDPEIAGLKQVRWIDGDYRIDRELSLFGDLTACENHLVPATNRYLMVKEGEEYIRDTFGHEQCLVIEEEGKRVLLSGCAHSGILNILDRFRQIYHTDPDVVISGFHLMKKKDYTAAEKKEICEIAAQLTECRSTTFYTCHCTGLTAFAWMKEIMGEQLNYCHCGDVLEV